MPKRTVRPWQANPETNRKKAARIERAQDRGEYTPPGTPSNGPKVAK